MTTVKVNIPNQINSQSIRVGIRGHAAAQTFISKLEDIDSTNLENGSVLVYKTATSKWTSTTTLNLQNMEGGEY